MLVNGNRKSRTFSVVRLATLQDEHRNTEREIRRRVRDRGEAVRGWRKMFQEHEISVKKFRNGWQRFTAEATKDRRECEAIGLRLFIPTPDQT
jgi:hypothetical protein